MARRIAPSEAVATTRSEARRARSGLRSMRAAWRDCSCKPYRRQHLGVSRTTPYSYFPQVRAGSQAATA
ncbi:Hypothetical protein MexAM1_META2p0166 (plasmid) [Methylorubrum extorquens AM1]|uniref:Uncharacterized protein n=1 Tax=Methylorubrum extorquens (strain ATCC 14718 / DSM 1338 / JCM 2805 / NCIMB 9133 / AM1) TaxID=272630 RepID=C5B3Q2_METEA|nr:Hypothetical protein MexAM1_META2p0166 [Methylorubrum extorquens AM1]